jgi:hypothetical protein
MRRDPDHQLPDFGEAGRLPTLPEVIYSAVLAQFLFMPVS